MHCAVLKCRRQGAIGSVPRCGGGDVGIAVEAASAYRFAELEAVFALRGGAVEEAAVALLSAGVL